MLIVIARTAVRGFVIRFGLFPIRTIVKTVHALGAINEVTVLACTIGTSKTGGVGVAVVIRCILFCRTRKKSYH
jgi:hypothetical protein